jgi:hypothetical protein
MAKKSKPSEYGLKTRKQLADKRSAETATALRSLRAFEPAVATASEKAGKPIEKAGKPIEKAGKPIEKAGKPIEKAGKPIEKGAPAEIVADVFRRVAALGGLFVVALVVPVGSSVESQATPVDQGSAADESLKDEAARRDRETAAVARLLFGAKP